MAESPEESVFHLAKQGDLQAIAIFLNQRLASKDSQVKLLKPQAGCLQMLLKVPQKAALEPLIGILQQQLLALRPDPFQIVRIYRPQPGTKTAHLIHKFAFPLEEPKDEDSTERLSVGEFLAHIRSVEDLQALEDHPFVTDKCPQCGYEFGGLDALPVFWDCMSCGWTDDLSHLASRETGSETSQQQEIDRILSQYLLEAGLVNEAQIQVAFIDQQTTHLRLGEALVQRGWINETTVEYMMEKIVLPEQGGLFDPSNLRLSRRLVKNLLVQHSSIHAEDSSQDTQELDTSPTHQSLDPASVIPSRDVSATTLEPNVSIEAQLLDTAISNLDRAETSDDGLDRSVEPPTLGAELETQGLNTASATQDADIPSVPHDLELPSEIELHELDVPITHELDSALDLQALDITPDSQAVDMAVDSKVPDPPLDSQNQDMAANAQDLELELAIEQHDSDTPATTQTPEAALDDQDLNAPPGPQDLDTSADPQELEHSLDSQELDEALGPHMPDLVLAPQGLAVAANSQDLDISAVPHDPDIQHPPDIQQGRLQELNALATPQTLGAVSEDHEPISSEVQELNTPGPSQQLDAGVTHQVLEKAPAHLHSDEATAAAEFGLPESHPLKAIESLEFNERDTLKLLDLDEEEDF